MKLDDGSEPVQRKRRKLEALLLPTQFSATDELFVSIQSRLDEIFGSYLLLLDEFKQLAAEVRSRER